MESKFSLQDGCELCRMHNSLNAAKPGRAGAKRLCVEIDPHTALCTIRCCTTSGRFSEKDKELRLRWEKANAVKARRIITTTDEESGGGGTTAVEENGR